MTMPAAKQNDQVVAVDIHIVMVPAPPAPPIPTPLPHPFVGMLDGGLSSDVQIMGMAAATVDSTASAKPSHIPTPPGTAFQKPPMNKATVFMGSATVLINGKPAARMGDMAMTCNDPSDLPVGTVIGTAATVLIGGPPSKAGQAAKGKTHSGGGAGGGESGKDSDSDAEKGTEGSVQEGSPGEAEAEPEDSFVAYKVLNAAGKALKGVEYELTLPDGTVEKGTVPSSGELRKDGVQPGEARLRVKGLYRPRWEPKVAVVDEEVELLVDAACYDDGTSVTFKVYREFQEGRGESIASVKGKVSQGVARAKWKYSYKKEDKGTSPRFVFHAILKEHRVFSEELTVGNLLELELKDTDGKVMGNQPVIVFAADGEERRGFTDAQGKLEIRGLAFGNLTVRLEGGAIVHEVKD